MQLRDILCILAASGAAAIAPLPSKTPAPTLFHRDEVSATPSPAPTGNFISTQFITLPGETNAYYTRPEKTITLALPTCAQTIKPDKNGYVPPGSCGAYFAYYPSFAAAIVTTIIFGILTGIHIFLAAKWKAVSKRWHNDGMSLVLMRGRATVGCSF